MMMTMKKKWILISLGDNMPDKLVKLSDWLTDEEINAVEDMFFCENTEEQYKQMRPHLVSAWKKLVLIDDEIKKEKKMCETMDCCPECNGTGLAIPNDFTRHCPKCKGLGLLEDCDDKESVID